MYKIECEFCGTENLFPKLEDKPIECSNIACQNSLEGLEVIQVNNEDETRENLKNQKIIGLRLIYQKTSEEIIINTDSKLILGRENFGSNLLSRIEQISRSHCSIEFRNNEYIIYDLGSTNGTFIGIGVDKVSCLNPQQLKDKDFLVMGKEVFLVQVLKEKGQKENEETLPRQTQVNEISKGVLCTECSCLLKSLPCSCPDCGTWNE